jgi:hypothetical protein
LTGRDARSNVRQHGFKLGSPEICVTYTLVGVERHQDKKQNEQSVSREGSGAGGKG